MRKLHGARWLGFLAAIVMAPQVAAQPLSASAPGPGAREMESQAKAMNRRVTAHVLRARRLREHAGAKDAIKLNCINDDMVPLLLQARISDAAFAAFNDAAATSDHDVTLARFAALTRAADAVDASSQNVRSCIGAREVEVHHQAFGGDPTRDCNVLGQSDCVSQSLDSRSLDSELLEYLSFASPFTPR